MESAQQSPQIADLVRILYRPRETMRRILDSGGDRWGVAVVVLAFVASATNDTDAYRMGEVLPGLKLLPAMAIIALSIIIGAISWVIALLIIAAIAAPIGRMLGGAATFADTLAALGWGMTPIVFSPIYRIPVAITIARFNVVPPIDVHKTVIDFLSHGGCSLIIIFLVLQLLFAIACIVLGSFTLAEAQRFSTQKGFVNLAISLALPLLVFFAAVFTFRW